MLDLIIVGIRIKFRAVVLRVAGDAAIPRGFTVRCCQRLDMLAARAVTHFALHAPLAASNRNALYAASVALKLSI